MRNLLILSSARFIRYSYGKKLCKNISHIGKTPLNILKNLNFIDLLKPIILSLIDLTRGTAGKEALVKLRISNHKLMIEIDRYNQTLKDNRHCPFCRYNVIEDEVHFLFQCPTYSVIRSKFYYKVKTLIPNITQLPINGLINELMNSSDYFINIYLELWKPGWQTFCNFSQLPLSNS